MKKIRTLFISDIHLGSFMSSADKLLEVFKDYEFDNLIINGDFIDMTSMKRKFFWNIDHSTVIQKVLRFSRKGVNVVYVVGNHDFYVRSLIEENNISLGNILICNEYIYKTSKGEKIYITHGDCFDGYIRISPWMYSLGDKAYYISVMVNGVYNKIRKIFGLDYWSLSAYLKTKVKNVVKFLSEYKKNATIKLKEKECDSIMIGHTHSPEISENYYNTGDFCESCSFIIENLEGDLLLLKVDN
jgi:UDP-2,3-diacylglucosamine pyrophosphatase LpxH